MITTREIVDRLKDIYDKLAASVSFRWGVVVSTTPPLVRLDADTDPVIVGTIAPLTVGSRVLVLLQNRKNTVIGSSGGDPNSVEVGGITYQRSGAFKFSEYTLTASGSLFYTIIPAALFPPLPSGYTRFVWVESTQVGFAVVPFGDGRVWLSRHISTASTVTIRWQLVKI